jgi:hypothetical protein
MGAERISDTAPSVAVFVPGTWAVLDLEPQTRVGSIGRLVEERIAGGPNLKSAREQMKAGLERAVESAAEQGAVLGYVLLTGDGGKIASASLFVSLVDAIGDVSVEGPDPAVAAGGLADRLRGEVRELPIGPAVRVQRRQSVALGDGPRSFDVEIVQWHVLEKTGRRLVTLTFSTPNIGLADQFGGVFDLIAATLRWAS